MQEHLSNNECTQQNTLELKDALIVIGNEISIHFYIVNLAINNAFTNKQTSHSTKNFTIDSFINSRNASKAMSDKRVSQTITTEKHKNNVTVYKAVASSNKKEMPRSPSVKTSSCISDKNVRPIEIPRSLNERTKMFNNLVQVNDL